MGGKLFAPAFQLFIARLLAPEDLGTFAIAVAWLAVFEVGKDWGLTQAIVISRGGSSETSLQFTAQLATAAAFFATTLLVAPIAAGYFSRPELIPIMPLVAATAFVSAVTDPLVTGHLVAQTYRRLAMRQILVPLAGGVIGLLLASRGFGAVSLAAGLLAGHIAGALSMLAGNREALRIRIDWSSTRQLMAVGRHVLIQRTSGFLVGHADSLIVGAVLGPVALGFYRMGHLIALLPPSASVSQVEQVLFTDLSANRDPGHLKARYDAFSRIAGSALLLYSVGVYLLAPHLVPWALGQHWTDAVPVTQLIAASAVTGFLTTLNFDLARIMGFARVYSHYAVIRSVATVLILLWAVQFSLLGAAAAWIVVGLASTLVNDVIFFRSQNVIRPTFTRLLIVALSWTWAAFVLVQLFGRTGA
jgi:PST family polysaccharide transporter